MEPIKNSEILDILNWFLHGQDNKVWNGVHEDTWRDRAFDLQARAAFLTMAEDAVARLRKVVSKSEARRLEAQMKCDSPTEGGKHD
jgi:hypothetical protein